MERRVDRQAARTLGQPAERVGPRTASRAAGCIRSFRRTAARPSAAPLGRTSPPATGPVFTGGDSPTGGVDGRPAARRGGRRGAGTVGRQPVHGLGRAVRTLRVRALVADSTGLARGTAGHRQPAVLQPGRFVPDPSPRVVADQDDGAVEQRRRDWQGVRPGLRRHARPSDIFAVGRRTGRSPSSPHGVGPGQRFSMRVCARQDPRGTPGAPAGRPAHRDCIAARPSISVRTRRNACPTWRTTSMRRETAPRRWDTPWKRPGRPAHATPWRLPNSNTGSPSAGRRRRPKRSASRSSKGLGDVLMLRGRYAAAQELFEEATQLAEGRVARAQIRGKLGGAVPEARRDPACHRELRSGTPRARSDHPPFRCPGTADVGLGALGPVAAHALPPPVRSSPQASGRATPNC